MRCVVNACRPETASPEGIADMARQMEARGRIRIDALINNTNLAGETTAEVILQGLEIVQRAAGILQIPVEFTMARRDLAPAVEAAGAAVLSVDTFIRPVWL